MFGFACDETPELMPLPIALAHRLARRLTQVRKDGTVPYLRPDGKTQVTIEYEDGKPVRLDTVVVSSQHAADIDLKTLLEPDIREHVVEPELAGLDIDTSSYRLLVNPTGRFEIGGPDGRRRADRSQDHRRLVRRLRPARRRRVLRQGPVEGRPVGGVRDALGGQERGRRGAGVAVRGQVAYAIGKAEPVGLFVETFGTGAVSDETIQQAITQVFDLRPAAIIRDLDLLRPIYSQTSAYGHFGRELPDFSWERTDKADELKSLALG
jgi:S-adenosylmethionine synthetase